HPAYLLGAPDYRVEQVFAGHLSEVVAETLQRLVALFRILISYAAVAADFAQGHINLFLVNTRFLENLGRCPASLVSDSQEQVLGGDELVAQPLGLLGCALDYSVSAQGDVSCAYRGPGRAKA